jgi:hypothetical protein
MQKDMSFVAGVQSATQMMADVASGDEKKYEKIGEQLVKTYLGFATRPLPQNNNAVQQIWKIFDPNAHSQADIKEMLGYAGGVQHFVNKESLDQFGEVVKSYPGETLLPYTHWLNLKGGDKRWEMLAKYNAIPQKIYNRTMQIETQDGIKKRQLEPEEMYDYVSRTGKLFSDAVNSYISNDENVVKRGAEIVEREKANGDLEKVSGVREDVEKMWAKARDHAETELFRWGTVKEEMPKAWEVIKANEAYQYYQVSKTTKGYKWNDSELYMLNNLASKYYTEEVVPYLQDTKLTKEDKADIDEETGKSYYEKELARIWKDALSLAEGDMMDLIEAKVENNSK